MTRREPNLLAAAALCALLGLADVASGQATTPPPQQQPRQLPAGQRPEDFGDRYGILNDKNIFLRGRPPTRRPGERSSRAARRREEEFLVTGFALQEGRRVALIENTATRSTQRVVQGESIAGGKITEVKFDSLEFETGGKQFKVAIGHNLLGETFTAAPAPEAPAGAAPAAAPAAGGAAAQAPAGAAPAQAANGAAAAKPGAPLPGDANLSLEERMKLRRAQQMK
jgi:hypothetical protein